MEANKKLYSEEYYSVSDTFEESPESFFNQPADDFIKTLKYKEVWDKAEIMYVPLTNNEENDKVNWKNPSQFALDNYTDNKNINIKYNGTFGYRSIFNTRWSVGDDANFFSLNEGCIVCFSESDPTDVAASMGAGGNTNSLTKIQITDSDGDLGYNINGPGGATENVNSAIGMYALNRINATTIELYYNGEFVKNIANNSLSLSSVWMGLNGALVTNDLSAWSYSKRVHSFWGVFGKLTAQEVSDLYDAFTTFRGEVKKQWLSDNSCELGISRYGAHYYPFGAFEKSGVVYKVTRSSVVSYSEKILFTIDQSDKAISEPVNIGLEVGDIDYHNGPAIIADDDNYLWMSMEKMDSSHITNMMFYKSDNPLDISSWTLNTEIVGGFSYNQFAKVGTTLLLFSRGPGGYHSFRKESGDAQWTHLGQVAGLPYGGKAYPNVFYDPDENKMCCAMLEVQTVTDRASEEIFYIESYDGETWYNAGHDFSKNIVESGAITTAELQSNCRIVHDASEEEARCLSIHGGVIVDGVPNIIISHGVVTLGGSDFESRIEKMRLYNWDGTSWMSNILPFVPTPYDSYQTDALSVQRVGSGQHILAYTDRYVVFQINPLDKREIKKYSSTDRINWTDEGVFYSDNIAIFGWMQTVYNKQSNDGENILFVNKMLPYRDFTAEAEQYGLVMKYF